MEGCVCIRQRYRVSDQSLRASPWAKDERKLWRVTTNARGEMRCCSWPRVNGVIVVGAARRASIALLDTIALEGSAGKR